MGDISTEDRLWLDFDVNTERVWSESEAGRKQRQTVSPEVIALRTMEATDEDMEKNDAFASRKVAAMDLVGQGEIIDMGIDVYGFGPANEYDTRRRYGKAKVTDMTGDKYIWTPPDPIPTSTATE